MLPDKPKDKLRQMGTTDPVAEAKKVYNTKRQPGFHESNKSFLEKLACCCVVDKDLTRIEVSNWKEIFLVTQIVLTFPRTYQNKRFQQFVWEHVKPYDETNARHEEALKTLFERVLDDEAREGADEKMKTSKWTDVGFQSANPRTDFRGGGLLGLLCILYLATECKDQFDLVK